MYKWWRFHFQELYTTEISTVSCCYYRDVASVDLKPDFAKSKASLKCLPKCLECQIGFSTPRNISPSVNNVGLLNDTTFLGRNENSDNSKAFFSITKTNIVSAGGGDQVSGFCIIKKPENMMGVQSNSARHCMSKSRTVRTSCRLLIGNFL